MQECPTGKAGCHRGRGNGGEFQSQIHVMPPFLLAPLSNASQPAKANTAKARQPEMAATAQ
jgi:hypothetical protein